MEISKVQTTTLYKKIIMAFTVIAVIILGIIIYFSLSKTIITITLEPQPKSTNFFVDVKQQLIDAEIASANKLTGYLLQTVVSGSQTFTNPNEGQEVEAPATGTVTIYNNWSEDQPLMATTRLLTPDGVLFRIKERADVPAGSTLKDVAVYADQPGISGNIGPTKFTIPGLWEGLQDKIYAESSQSMTGGVIQAKVVTQEILNQAATSLKQKLYQQAKTDFEQTEEIKNSNDTVSIQSFSGLILEEEYDAELGEEKESFDTSMTLKVTTAIFDQNKLITLALKNLEQTLAADESVDSYQADDLVYKLDEYNFNDQTASLQVTFTALVVPRLSNPIFNRDNLVNKDDQEIKAYFSNFDAIKNVDIKFSPFWVTKAPSLKDHIEIKISD